MPCGLPTFGLRSWGADLPDGSRWLIRIEESSHLRQNDPDGHPNGHPNGPGKPRDFHVRDAADDFGQRVGGSPLPAGRPWLRGILPSFMSPDIIIVLAFARLVWAKRAGTGWRAFVW